MIKLVENKHEASLVLNSLHCDIAPLLATKMFTEGFGVERDFLQVYSAFNDSGRLCAAFVKCNDRVFCLIEKLYNRDEIVLFLNGFSDFNIFISSEYAHIIERQDKSVCCLMKKAQSCGSNPGTDITDIDSQLFSKIIMCDKTKDEQIRFLLNNSHLQRHGYINNYALIKNDEIVCVASVFENESFAYLCNVFTPAEHRRQGRAQELINYVSDTKRECHLICSESVSALYQKCGFVCYAKWIEFLY